MKTSHVCARLFPAVLVATTAFLAGCMSYPVNVNTRRETAPAPAERTYFLQSTTSASLQLDRHFKPALICLRAAMAHRGFTEVAAPDQAALLVDFDYGVTSAGVDRSFRPVPRNDEPREIYNISTAQKVQIIPRSQVGVVTTVEPRYTVWVRIIAQDVRSKKEIWSVTTHAEIGAADHNNILPCLIAAAEPNLEPAASTQLLASIGQEAPEVKALRSGR